jgi:hypothetical protein
MSVLGAIDPSGNLINLQCDADGVLLVSVAVEA